MAESQLCASGEGLPTPYTYLKGSGRGCPLLRASNEHFLNVRVPRAGRHLAGPVLLFLSLGGWGLIDLLLRASNEGLLRPRVARAQKIISPHSLPLFVNRLVTRGWNSVPLTLLPQSLTRQTEYLRAGRATAVYSL